MNSPFTEYQLDLLYGKRKEPVFLCGREAEKFQCIYVNAEGRQLLTGTAHTESGRNNILLDILGQACAKAFRAGEPQMTSQSVPFLQPAGIFKMKTTPFSTEEGDFVLIEAANWSAQKEAEEDTFFFKALMRHSAEPVIILSAEGRVYAVSRSFEETFGTGEPVTEGLHYRELPGIMLEEEPAFKDQLVKVLAGAETLPVPVRWKKADGTASHFLTSVSPIITEGKTHGFFVFLQEFTEALQLKATLKETANVLESYKKAINYSAMVAISEPDGTLTFVNDKFTETTGFSESELIGTNIIENDARFLSDEKLMEIKEALQARSIWKGELQGLRKDGEPYWVDATIIPLQDENGEVQQVLSIRFDSTEKKEAEKNLKRMAFHDSLTKLPNRRYIMRKFEELRTEADLHGHHLGILYIDGDNFKRINDGYGHGTGDEFIYQFGQVLKTNVREADLVGRIGGDEFLIVLGGLPPEEAEKFASEVTERIARSLAEGWKIDGKHFSASASAGVAFYPADGRELDELIHNGDTALYQAKKMGKGGSVFYSKTVC